MPFWFVSLIVNMRRAISIISLRKALSEQELLPLYNQLNAIVPNIRKQYTSFEIDNEYLEIKVRGLHAFQVYLVEKALKIIDRQLCKQNNVTLVDIGDSAGTHIQYIKSIFGGKYNLRCISVNMDPQAVERIKSKNLEAICVRAECLSEYSIDADVYLSFEMLEHLMDPMRFLYELSDKTNCKAFVVTVPYLKNSRVALHHIRNKQVSIVSSETTHIYEFSPQDWRLIFQHAGWKIVYEKVYLQYPQKSLFVSRLKNYWGNFDFEGFYGAILVRDKSWSKLYKDWE